MIETIHKAYEFEILLADLFKHYGYAVENDNKVTRNDRVHRADLIISNSKSEKIIVEVKYTKQEEQITGS